MTFTAAFVITTWIALLLLTLGVVGCLRNIKLLAEAIDARLQSPVRVTAGDRVSLPAVYDRPPGTAFSALLFVQAECGSCLLALERLREALTGRSDIDLLVLWKGDRHPKYAQVGIPHATDAFRSLNVGLTPYFVLLSDDKVVMASRAGSSEHLERIESALRGPKSEAGGPVPNELVDQVGGQNVKQRHR